LAGSSLLTLIDDIATLLDDVAILSKVAVKKTAGVLGDDLALNAEQVSGVKAERELPVVWAVMKGSFLNKLILVPAALLISAFAPPLITVLLVIGGLFLCFEGAEKLAEKFLHSKESNLTKDEKHQKKLVALADENIDLVALEQEKIKGAIRTDFVLSAEIVVIVLGTVKESPFEMQVMVLSALALLITVGVYGIVAAIVKLDDLGLYLLRKSVSGSYNEIQRFAGRLLLILAPKLMKSLAIIGTIAMFLVGGGILVHSFHGLHEKVAQFILWLNGFIPSFISDITGLLVELAIGVIAGLVVFSVLTMFTTIKSKMKGEIKEQAQ